MDRHVLVKDEKYGGKYVAMRSVIDHTVIAEGQNPEEVLKKAKENGCDQPMIMYVPDKSMTCCY